MAPALEYLRMFYVEGHLLEFLKYLFICHEDTLFPPMVDFFLQILSMHFQLSNLHWEITGYSISIYFYNFILQILFMHFNHFNHFNLQNMHTDRTGLTISVSVSHFFFFLYILPKLSSYSCVWHLHWYQFKFLAHLWWLYNHHMSLVGHYHCFYNPW